MNPSQALLILIMLGYAALIVYWLLAVLVIIGQDRDPSTTLAWIAVLLLTPGLGLVIYFFAGRDWKGWLAKQRWVHDWVALRRPFMESIYATHKAFTVAARADMAGTVSGKVSAAIEAANSAPVLPATTFDVYEDGAEYFDTLIADLSSAQRSIVMQYFIWEHDALTARITEVLLDRLAAGVDVRIMNDYLGCITYNKSELKRLRKAGARVESDITQIGRLNYRNHRKITVVDGIIGHTGGFNIGQEYIDGKPKYPAWRDTGLRLTGPVVAELAKLFADRWYEVKHESLYVTERFAAGCEGVEGDTVAAQVVAHGVEDPSESARRAHVTAISGASERVWLQSPYFIPDAGTYDALLNAALSGVDVRLMMTDWPDKKIAMKAAESYYEDLLAAGGRIFRYTKGFFHAKSLTVDGVASSVGTMNLDMRSLKLHKELMVWCYDANVASRCERIFEADLRDCREVTIDEVRGWSRLRRFGNSAARLGSNIM